MTDEPRGPVGGSDENASGGTDPLSNADRDPLDARARYCQVTENRGTERDRRLLISARAAGMHV
jgi:hypothetical protein